MLLKVDFFSQNVMLTKWKIIFSPQGRNIITFVAPWCSGYHILGTPPFLKRGGLVLGFQIFPKKGSEW